MTGEEGQPVAKFTVFRGRAETGAPAIPKAKGYRGASVKMALNGGRGCDATSRSNALSVANVVMVALDRKLRKKEEVRDIGILEVIFQKPLIIQLLSI